MSALALVLRNRPSGVGAASDPADSLRLLCNLQWEEREGTTALALSKGPSGVGATCAPDPALPSHDLLERSNACLRPPQPAGQRLHTHERGISLCKQLDNATLRHHCRSARHKVSVGSSSTHFLRRCGGDRKSPRRSRRCHHCRRRRSNLRMVSAVSDTPLLHYRCSGRKPPRRRRRRPGSISSASRCRRQSLQCCFRPAEEDYAFAAFAAATVASAAAANAAAADIGKPKARVALTPLLGRFHTFPHTAWLLHTVWDAAVEEWKVWGVDGGWLADGMVWQAERFVASWDHDQTQQRQE